MPAGLGFLGFWYFCIWLLHLIFAWKLEILPDRTSYGSGLLYVLSVPTGKIEDVRVSEGLFNHREIEIIADEGAVAVSMDNAMTAEQAEWLAAWIRWAVHKPARKAV